MTAIDEPLEAPATAPLLQPAPWPAVAFVCGRCEDRKGAPKSLGTKQVGKKLREGFREARLRSRVVTTGCMGLCPRGALVVAVGVAGAPLAVVELRKKRDVAAVVAALLPPPDPRPSFTEGTP